MSEQERYVRRALKLARGPAHTSPNPRVGAVIVRDGEVISEGAHQGAGTRHAEAVALEGVDAVGATVYVNLEPCTHQGRMPPCAPALIDAGVSRVVVAVPDPDERVSGAGIALLRAAGIEVDVGLLADEATRLNAPFLHHRRTGRAYLTVKLGLSIDGRLGAPDGSARWITGPEARKRVHARRLEVDAVLVGAGTVLADDPRLDARDVEADRQPTRIVLDTSGRISPKSKLFALDGQVIVATTNRSAHEMQLSWKETGAEVLVLPERAGRVDVGALLQQLGERGFIEIYCEGGAELATTLLRDGLVDRIEANYGPVLLGRGGPEVGSLGITSMSDAIRWKTTDVTRMGDDVVVVMEKA
jgi:diaminohydroxyphosphoribosylaminopyrimidine deaminase / 5-amino-6-(5-phosphoribosylamino)uracil reductase